MFVCIIMQRLFFYCPLMCLLRGLFYRVYCTVCNINANRTATVCAIAAHPEVVIAVMWHLRENKDTAVDTC